MARSSSMILPVILGASALGLIFFTGKPAQMAPPSPTPTPPIPIPPIPIPPGPLPPGPGPGPTPQEQLLQQFSILVQQATTNPNSVNPDQLDQLANQLEASGRTIEAGVLRQLSLQIRMTRGPLPPSAQNPPPGGGLEGGILTPPGQPAPGGINPGIMPVGLVNQMNFLMNNPAAEPTALEALANTLQPMGFLTQVTQLRNKARELRQLRGQALR